MMTVFATLPTPSNEETRIELTPDRKVLSITHNGERSILDLPCPLNCSVALETPAGHLKELSFRLQLSSDYRAEDADETSTAETSMWPASALTPETQVACRSCNNILVKDSITTWKDLPSENWAEMMDFWHCHKPHVEEDVPEQNGSTKGYSASNGYTLRPGIGFVDDLYLRLASSDCTGLQVSLLLYYFRTAAELLSCTVCTRATRRRYVSTPSWTCGIPADTITLEQIPRYAPFALSDYPLHIVLNGFLRASL